MARDEVQHHAPILLDRRPPAIPGDPRRNQQHHQRDNDVGHLVAPITPSGPPEGETAAPTKPNKGFVKGRCRGAYNVRTATGSASAEVQCSAQTPTFVSAVSIQVGNLSRV